MYYLITKSKNKCLFQGVPRDMKKKYLVMLQKLFCEDWYVKSRARRCGCQRRHRVLSLPVALVETDNRFQTFKILQVENQHSKTASETQEHSKSYIEIYEVRIRS